MSGHSEKIVRVYSKRKLEIVNKPSESDDSFLSIGNTNNSRKLSRYELTNSQSLLDDLALPEPLPKRHTVANHEIFESTDEHPKKVSRISSPDFSVHLFEQTNNANLNNSVLSFLGNMLCFGSCGRN